MSLNSGQSTRAVAPMYKAKFLVMALYSWSLPDTYIRCRIYPPLNFHFIVLEGFFQIGVYIHYTLCYSTIYWPDKYSCFFPFKVIPYT